VRRIAFFPEGFRAGCEADLVFMRSECLVLLFSAVLLPPRVLLSPRRNDNLFIEAFFQNGGAADSLPRFPLEDGVRDCIQWLYTEQL